MSRLYEFSVFLKAKNSKNKVTIIRKGYKYLRPDSCLCCLGNWLYYADISRITPFIGDKYSDNQNCNYNLINKTKGEK